MLNTFQNKYLCDNNSTYVVINSTYGVLCGRGPSGLCVEGGGFKQHTKCPLLQLPIAI